MQFSRIGCFIDIFAAAKSIYGLRPFDIAALRYDLNPLSPRRAYRVTTHIERFAYIENPVRDLYRVLHGHTPASGVFQLAGLDAGDGIVELLGQLADGAAIDGHDLIHIAQLAHGRDDSGGAGAPALLQSAVLLRLDQLVSGDLALLHGVAPASAQLQDGVAGDAGQDGAVELGGDDGAIDLEEDVHGADFLDVLALHAVQPQNLGVTGVVGLLLGDQGSGVVAAGLGIAHAAADSADVLILDPDAHGSQTGLVVSAGGGQDDHEQVGLGGSNAQELIGGDDEGTDVQGGAGLGGDPVAIHIDNSGNSLHEVLNGQLRNDQTLVGGVGALCVHVGTEQVNLTVLGVAVCLQTLEHLLTIVVDHGGGRQGNVVEGLDPGIVPALALGVVHNEHVIRKDLAEAQLGALGGLFLGFGG